MKLFTIPNLLTCLNLLCGVLGIVLVLEGAMLYIASWLIVLAAVFDFLDGFAARMFNQSSPIGKELDSLADVVSFGVLPAVILYELMGDAEPYNPILAYIPLALISVFSALRLAKFNIDTRQSDSFIGVPTPANGLLVASLPLILTNQPEYNSFIINQYALLGYTFVMSFLLVSEIPLLAFKFKTFDWVSNQSRYIFLIIAIILMILLKFAAIPLIVGLYVLLSLFKKK